MVQCVILIPSCWSLRRSILLWKCVKNIAKNNENFLWYRNYFGLCFGLTDEKQYLLIMPEKRLSFLRLSYWPYFFARKYENMWGQIIPPKYERYFWKKIGEKNSNNLSYFFGQVTVNRTFLPSDILIIVK